MAVESSIGNSYKVLFSHMVLVSLGDLTNLDTFLPASWTCAPKKFWLVTTRTHSASLRTQNPPLGHYSGCTLSSGFSIPEVFVCHLPRGLSGFAPVVWILCRPQVITSTRKSMGLLRFTMLDCMLLRQCPTCRFLAHNLPTICPQSVF